MIIKSLIILSILLNGAGLDSLALKLDNAVIRDQAGAKKVVEASSQSIGLPDILPRPKVKEGALAGRANARHYILVDMDSNKVLAKYDQNARVPIASTTKIMTALVVLENYELDDVVTVSEGATTQVGADSFLRPGEKITVLNLLNCLLIKSGNDAAYALAENMNPSGVFGTELFVKKMNEKAKELGLKNTNYADPAGLDTTGYSSAYDLYMVTKAAFKFETFREIVVKERWSAKNVDGTIWHDLKQSNRLVAEYNYPGAIGVKTGFMPEAGHCLVGAAKRDGHTLIAIILSTYLDTPSASADEAKRLLDWGFTNIVWN